MCAGLLKRSRIWKRIGIYLMIGGFDGLGLSLFVYSRSTVAAFLGACLILAGFLLFVLQATREVLEK